MRRLIPDAVLIFILPPSLASLRERLEKRGQDAPEVIARRLEAAREEMRHCGDFDYVIMNQDFARAVDDLSAIVRAARLTASRQGVRHAALDRAIGRTLNINEVAMARITIEDCLDKIPNRFELTLAATNRARQISAGSAPLVDPDRDKPTVIALREVAPARSASKCC